MMPDAKADNGDDDEEGRKEGASASPLTGHAGRVGVQSTRKHSILVRRWGTRH